MITTKLGVRWMEMVCCLLILSAASRGFEVVQLQEYVRHGARTASSNLLKTDITLQYGIGSLTPNGYRMHYMLGSQIRKNYPQIFNDKIGQNDVEAFCSHVPRTFLSAYSHMLGLFPLGTGKDITVANDSKNILPPFEGLDVSWTNTSALPYSYQPLPISMKSEEIDTLFLPTIKLACPPAYNYTESEKKLVYQQVDPKLKPLSDKLKAAGVVTPDSAGKDYGTEELGLLYDEAKSYLNYYNKLMPNLTQSLFDELYLAGNINFNILYPTEKVRQLYSSEVAAAILDGMRAVANGTSTKKFRIYSGHDMGVMSHLIGFGLTSLECNLEKLEKGKTDKPCEPIPEFAASFLYELSEKDGKHFVRLFYNGKFIKICSASDADDYCSLETFAKIVEKKLFFAAENGVSKEDFCGSPYYRITKTSEPDGTSLLEFLLICVVLLLLIVLTLLIAKEQSMNKSKYAGSFSTSLEEATMGKSILNNTEVTL